MVSLGGAAPKCFCPRAGGPGVGIVPGRGLGWGSWLLASSRAAFAAARFLRGPPPSLSSPFPGFWGGGTRPLSRRSFKGGFVRGSGRGGRRKERLGKVSEPLPKSSRGAPSPNQREPPRAGGIAHRRSRTKRQPAFPSCGEKSQAFPLAPLPHPGWFNSGLEGARASLLSKAHAWQSTEGGS